MRIFFFLALLLVSDGSEAQATPQVLNLTYALVEVTPGIAPSVSISLGEGVPPVNSPTHLYGVPTVLLLRQDETGPFKGPSTLHFFRYYVLGVPSQLRIADLELGTVTTVSVGDPPLVLPGQNYRAGVLFPDAHFIGTAGDSSSRYVLSTTVGHYRRHMSFASSSGGSGAPRIETSIGLMPQGDIYGYDANFRGHRHISEWTMPVDGSPRSATLYITHDYGSSGTMVTGGRSFAVPFRYVVGY